MTRRIDKRSRGRSPVDFDIAIAGGGMAGASLALALRGTGHRVALIEAVDPGEHSRPAGRRMPADEKLAGANPAPQARPGYDDRGIALSLASERVLRHIGVWDQVGRAAFPIRRVHVSEQFRFGCVRLDAGQLGVEALGHVVVARALGAILRDCVRAARWIVPLCPDSVTGVEMDPAAVHVHCRAAGMLRCRLLVVADGAESGLRAALGIHAASHDYSQTAIVANVTCRGPHHGTAFERFTKSGPLALLPLEGPGMVAVNCVSAGDAAGWLSLGETEYCDRLGTKFGMRLGGFMRCGARRAYPLRRVVPDRQVSGRALLLGNAALTIHPNGAQGFNLVLRDAAALAELLAAADDPGAAGTLQAFLAQRQRDRERVAWLTHGLARGFASTHPLIACLRRTGMLMAELLPTVKRDLILLGAGLRPPQPDCVRSVV
ncbi:MAG: FAD-dependent monooxygenase [Gammaproteobacteria bacterium]|nr:FAD-dependent monooxygenase [Gammaproteobacteria bacterium]